MALRTPEVSLGMGLATATVVYGIYQGALPNVADVRSLDAHNKDVESAERLAAWTAAGVVAGISLLAKDATVFILGGSMVVAMSWWHRHADAVVPAAGKATTGGSAMPGATPRVTQSEAPDLYAVPETPAYEGVI